MKPTQEKEQPVKTASPVHVTINGHPYEIPSGKVSVQVLKKLAGIPTADELAELIDGKVEALRDDGMADVSRCDVFTSYPRSCASS